jgi:hypothetical protein
MRTLIALLCASLFAAPAARADVDVVVVGAFLGGSPTGGDPAPDGDGVFFGAGVPVINDAGQVAFPCSFTTGSGGTAIVRGSTAPGDRHLVVRQGDPAPDANGNFSSFDLATVDINDAGQVVFAGTFTGTFGPPGDTSGIIRGDVGPDRLTQLARAGQTVDGVKLISLGNPPPVLNASGQVVFTSLLTGAILLHSGSSNSVVVRAGQDAPDASGTINALFSEPPALNDLGQVAFVPLVVPTSGFGIEEFVRADGPTLTQVVHDGDPAPDHNGTFDLFTTITVVRPPALNGAGEIGFVAALAGVTGPGTKGIFRASDPDHVVQIVRRGDMTPDANGSFLDFNFRGIDSLPFNDAGQAAFLATLTGTSNGSADNVGIFRGDGTTLVRIVRKSQAAPDADGSFSDFDTPAINAAGKVAFRATLTDTAKTQGIFLYDDVGGLTQVVRQGDPLLGSTIAAMGFAPDSSFGRTHVGINASGQIAFQFGLADGRVGVAVWSPGSTTTTTTTTTTTSSTALTTTTLGGTSTTTTTVATTSTTSTTIGTPSSTTSTTIRSTPTTTPIPPTTTTTLPPCTTLRCIVGAARNGSSCTGQTIPASITKKLDLAITQAELAPSQTAKKAKHLYKSAGHLLTKAGKLATRAAGGRHPKLSTQCAADLLNAIHAAAALAAPPT